MKKKLKSTSAIPVEMPRRTAFEDTVRLANFNKEDTFDPETLSIYETTLKMADQVADAITKILDNNTIGKQYKPSTLSLFVSWIVGKFFKFEITMVEIEKLKVMKSQLDARVKEGTIERYSPSAFLYRNREGELCSGIAYQPKYKADKIEVTFSEVIDGQSKGQISGRQEDSTGHNARSKT